VGATFEVLRADGAHKDCWEVIEHEPPRAFACRRLDTSAFLQCRYTLHNIDGRTGLCFEVYAGSGTSPEPPHRFEQSAQRQLVADLSRLRGVLESRFREEGMRAGDAADGAHGCGAGPGVQPVDARGHHAQYARRLPEVGAVTGPEEYKGRTRR
jgi:hypothetical protein